MEVVVRASSLRVSRNARTVVADADWTVRRGERWALWGPNGSGKSTLLEVLAGSRSGSDGTVRHLLGAHVELVAQEPDLPAVGTLEELVAAGLPALRRAEQDLREEEARLARDAGDLDRYADLYERFERAGGYRGPARLQRELDLVLPGRRAGDALASLSSGERRRVALALAFAARPDLLLLDEPSNGLDVGMRAWLASRLGTLQSMTALVVASHDRDLLGRIGRASARLGEGRLEARRIGFDAHRAELGVVARSALERRRSLGSGVTLASRGELRGPLLRARGLSLPGGFDDLALDVEAGAKIALLGANGTGKSSLLSLLAAEKRPSRPSAEVWLRPGARSMYWDATRRGLAGDAIVRQLERWVPSQRAASLLALVGLPQDRWSAPPLALSGGERARAALALLLASEPDLVLLDEPERDLDLPGIDLLEQALTEPRTTVVLVTHDLRLAEAVADDVRSVGDGRLRSWRGGVAGWRAGHERREGDRPGPGGATVELEDPLPPRVGDALQAIPVDPTVLEDEQTAIEALLEDPTRWTARQRERLARRGEQLIAARMAAYDAVLPSPAPRYRASEPPLELHADRDGDTLTFLAEDWPTLPRLQRIGSVVHLVLPDPPGACWAPWARAAALRACLALVVPLLAPAAVQTRAGPGPVPAPFVVLDGTWWVAPREAWERFAGFGGATTRQVR